MCGGCLSFRSAGHAGCAACTCFAVQHPSVTVDPAVMGRVGPDSAGFLPHAGESEHPCEARWQHPDGAVYVCNRRQNHLIDRDDENRFEHAAHMALPRVPRHQYPMIARWTHGFGIEPTCTRCGQRFRNLISRCEQASCRTSHLCTRCCVCNRVPHQEQTGTFVGEPSKRYPRYLGIEIECGKLSDAKVAGFHHIKAVADRYGLRIGSDGSLGNFRASTELSTVPARGDAFKEQIQALCTAIAEDELKANATCGLHVHVDVRDYTMEHLLRFVRVYSIVEPALYRIIAPSRRTNHYSAEWGTKFASSGCLRTDSTIEERGRRLLSMLYGSASEAASYHRSRSKHENRYHGANLNAVYVHGTIEFRMHHGSVNPVKILMWSAICSALVEYAFRHDEDTIRRFEKMSKLHIVLQKIVDDAEVTAWMTSRRLFFLDMERKQRGLPPRARALKPVQAAMVELNGPELSETHPGSTHPGSQEAGRAAWRY